jgi:hypothetical protein
MPIFHSDSGSFKDLVVTGSTLLTGSLVVSGTVSFPTITNSTRANLVSIDTASGQLYYAATSSFTAATASHIQGGQDKYIALWTGSTQLTRSIILQTGSTIGINTANPNQTYGLDIKGSVQSTGLSVTGSTTLSGSSTTIISPTVIRGNTTITGSTLITGSAGIIGATTIFGNTTITGSTILSGSSTTINSPTTITGNTTITGSLITSGSSHIIRGNTTITGSTIISGSFELDNIAESSQANFLTYIPSTGNVTYAATSSFTASWAVSASQAISSSFATTASYSPNSGKLTNALSQSTGITSFTYDGSATATVAISSSNLAADRILKWTGTAFTTSSLSDTGTLITGISSIQLSGNDSRLTGSFTGSLTGALTGTASWATNATTATTALNANTASQVENGRSPYMALWQTATRLTSSRTIYEDSNGNIGIGNISPTSKLHVIGSTILSGSSSTTALTIFNSVSEQNLILLTRTPTSDGEFRIRTDQGANENINMQFSSSRAFHLFARMTGGFDGRTQVAINTPILPTIAQGATFTVSGTIAFQGLPQASFPNLLVYNTSNLDGQTGNRVTYLSTSSIIPTTSLTASYVTGSVFISTNPALSASYAVSSSFAPSAGKLNNALSQSTGITTFAYDGSSTATVAISSSNLAADKIIKWTGAAFTTSSLTDTGTLITGISSIQLTGNSSILTGSFTGSLTGALTGTASWAESASNAINARTASFLPVGIYQITASWAQSASNAINAQTASFLTAGTYQITASLAQTASQVENGRARYMTVWETNTRLTSSTLLYETNSRIGIGNLDPRFDIQVDDSKNVFFAGNGNTETATGILIGKHHSSSSLSASRTYAIIGVTNSDALVGAANGDIILAPRNNADNTGIRFIYTGSSVNTGVIIGQGFTRNNSFVSGNFALPSIQSNNQANFLSYNSSTGNVTYAATNSFIAATASQVENGRSRYMTLWETATRLTSSKTLYEAADGTIGVNTTTPISTYTLDVNGKVNSKGFDATGSNNLYNVANSTDILTIKRSPTSDVSFKVRTDGPANDKVNFQFSSSAANHFLIRAVGGIDNRTQVIINSDSVNSGLTPNATLLVSGTISLQGLPQGSAPTFLVYNPSNSTGSGTNRVTYLSTSSFTATNSLTSSYPIDISGSTLYVKGPAASKLPTAQSQTDNIFFGTNAGAAFSLSSVFIGPNAASAGRVTSSVMIGDTVGPQSNTPTSYAVLIGTNAGAGDISTNINYSNFIGVRAGYQSTSQSNFIGYGAGDSATRANNSVFIGTFAGAVQTEASNSIIIGNRAGSNSGSLVGVIGANNIIIGTNVTVPVNANRAINIGGVIFATGSYATITGAPFSGSIDPTVGRVGIGIRPTVNHTLVVSGSIATVGSVTGSNFAPNPGFYTTHEAYLSESNNPSIIYVFPTGSYKGLFIDYIYSDMASPPESGRMGTFNVMWSGSRAYFQDVTSSNIKYGSFQPSLSASISASNVVTRIIGGVFGSTSYYFKLFVRSMPFPPID